MCAAHSSTVPSRSGVFTYRWVATWEKQFSSTSCVCVLARQTLLHLGGRSGRGGKVFPHLGKWSLLHFESVAGSNSSLSLLCLFAHTRYSSMYYCSGTQGSGTTNEYVGVSLSLSVCVVVYYLVVGMDLPPLPPPFPHLAACVCVCVCATTTTKS